jgi:hypothetical protein
VLAYLFLNNPDHLNPILLLIKKRNLFGLKFLWFSFYVEPMVVDVKHEIHLMLDYFLVHHILDDVEVIEQLNHFEQRL